MFGRGEIAALLLLALLIRNVVAKREVNWETMSRLPIDAERIGINTRRTIERRNAKLAFEREDENADSSSFSFTMNKITPKVIWYKMDKPRIVAKFSFRNSRVVGARDEDPIEFDFIASKDCTNEKIKNFKNIKTVKNLDWRIPDEEKIWMISDAAAKNMLMENEFNCYGIKVTKTRGAKKAALQDIKIWILTKREVNWELRRQLVINEYQRHKSFFFNGRKTIWFKMGRPEIVAQFSFRNGRLKKDMKNNPIDFDFIASKDCSKWKTIMTIIDMEWYTNNEEKFWRISNPADKLKLMDNQFNCYGIRVTKFSGEFEALQDLKFWIVSSEYFGNVMVRGLPVCDATWDNEAAKKVCTQELNFGMETKGIATNNGRFGKSPNSYIDTDTGCEAKKERFCDGFLNRAKGGVPSSSSSRDTASEAFGGPKAEWRSKKGMPQWVQYKMEHPIPICKISFRPLMGKGENVVRDCPKSYTFQGSYDGKIFEPLLSEDDENCNPGDVFFKYFRNEKPFNFYRLSVTNVPGRAKEGEFNPHAPKYAAIRDLQFFSHNDEDELKGFRLVDLSEGEAGATSISYCDDDGDKKKLEKGFDKEKLYWAFEKRVEKKLREATCGKPGETLQYNAANAFKRAFMNSNGTGLKYVSLPWMSDSTPFSSKPQIVYIQLPRAVKVAAFKFYAFPIIPRLFIHEKEVTYEKERFTSWGWQKYVLDHFESIEDSYLKHTPTSFELVGSNDCNSGDWTTILYRKATWKFGQGKRWTVPEKKRRPFSCIGLRVLENGWGKKGNYAVIHGVKLWEKKTSEFGENSLGCTYKSSKGCPAGRIAGVICLNPNNLKLVNENESEDEGNVLLQGYPICGINWGREEAQVVCNSLLGERFKDTTDAQVPVFEATGNSAFGPAPNDHFIMSNVRCKGDEKHLTDCPSNYYPQASGNQRNCAKDQAAGVKCAKCTVAYLKHIVDTFKGRTTQALTKSATTALKKLKDNCRAWNCNGTWLAYPEFCAVSRFLRSVHLMGRKENEGNEPNRRVVSIKFNMYASLNYLIDHDSLLKGQKHTIDALAELQTTSGEFQKKLGLYFTTMSQWELETAKADLALAKRIMINAKSQLNNKITKFGTNLNKLITAAFTKAGFAVHDKTLQIGSSLATMYSPIVLVDWGRIAEATKAVMAAAGNLGDAVYDIAQLTYLTTHTFPQFVILGKNISKNFEKKKDWEKEMGRILEIDDINDFNEKDAEKFLELYKNVKYALATMFMKKYEYLLTEVVDKTCEILQKDGSGVIGAGVKLGFVGLCPEVKLEKKMLIELLYLIKGQDLKVTFDIYVRIAKEKLSINMAKSFQTTPYSLDAINKAIIGKKSLYLYRMQKEALVNGACDLIKYRNFGDEESYCKKLRINPNIDLEVLKKALKGSNANRCGSNIMRKSVNIPAVAKRSGNSTPIAEGTLDLATLLDPTLSNSVEFQIPNKQWLVDNGWLNSREVSKGPFYLTEFELFLPPYYALAESVTVELDLIKNTLVPHGVIDAFDEPVSFILKYRDATKYCLADMEVNSPYSLKDGCASIPKPCREMKGEYRGQNIYPSLMSLWKVRLSVDARMREVRPIDQSGVFNLRANVAICSKQSQRPKTKTATRNANENPTKCCDDKSIWVKKHYGLMCKECPPNSLSRLHGYYCESCPAGFEPREATYGEHTDQVWGCKPCKANFFKDSKGMNKCQRCPIGRTTTASLTCNSGIDCCGQSLP